jgi:hypothetical protein
MTLIAAPERPRSYWAPHWMPPRLTAGHGEVPLPDFLHGEVEIARVVVDAVVPEVFSLRARRAQAGRPYRYQVVDGMDTPFLLPRDRSAGPLALTEVVALLDGTRAPTLPWGTVPFVEGCVAGALAAGIVTPKEAATALRVESAVYASLGAHYAPRIAAAVRAWGSRPGPA